MPAAVTLVRSTYTDADSFNAAAFNALTASSASVPDATPGNAGVMPGTTTAAGLALTNAIDAAAQRTLLGLVIGTDVLAPNGSGALLTALNASNLSSGTVPLARLYTTLAGYGISDGITAAAVAAGYQPLSSNLALYAAITPSANTQSFLGAANYSAMRTQLGAGAASGLSTLDAGGKIPTSQIPDSVLGQVEYQGSYNAATNTPTLSASPATTTKGDYYVVTVAGTFDSVTYAVGDWIISNGTIWQKIDNTDAVTMVAGRTGAITLTTADIGGLGTIATQPASAVAITGGSITNTPISGSTGAFTTLSASGDVTLAATSNLIANKSVLLSDGTAGTATGAFYFINDTDTGFYRAGGNTLGFMGNGASLGTWSPTVLAVIGALSSTTGLTLNDGSSNSPNINFQTTSGTRIMDMDGSTVRILNMAATNARLQLTDAGNLTVDGSVNGQAGTFTTLSATPGSGVSALTVTGNSAGFFADFVATNLADSGIRIRNTGTGGRSYNLSTATDASGNIPGAGLYLYDSTGAKLVWSADTNSRFNVYNGLAVTGGLNATGALAIGNTVAAAVAVASTHKVTIVIGGVTYYLLATNV